MALHYGKGSLALKIRGSDIMTSLLRLLPAEFAHELALHALKQSWFTQLWPERLYSGEITRGLSLKIPGLGVLKHPIGLAAGFDKNASAVKGLQQLGFSFLEVGTVTPLGQDGNPKPRLFRMSDTRGLINRMGFNNDGMEIISQRLERLEWRHEHCPLGVNTGKNRLTSDVNALDDYVAVLTKCRNLARYFVVNVSSPNTAGLRDLASISFLGALLQAVPELKPRLWIKLDPDMSRERMQAIVAFLTEQDVQGLILTNTHRTAWPEAGGMSGHSLLATTMSRLEWAWEVHRGKLAMIASGGLMSGHDVLQALWRGAQAVQIYTAMIYRGPYVVWKMLLELQAEMQLRGISHLEDQIGRYYARDNS